MYNWQSKMGGGWKIQVITSEEASNEQQASEGASEEARRSQTKVSCNRRATPAGGRPSLGIVHQCHQPSNQNPINKPKTNQITKKPANDQKPTTDRKPMPPTNQPTKNQQPTTNQPINQPKPPRGPRPTHFCCSSKVLGVTAS